MKYSTYKTFEWRTLTVFLFFISTLQTMIFGFYQIADHLLGANQTSKIIPLNLVFFAVMLVTSIFHPFIMRRFTLKFALLAGLFFDVLGLFLLLINEATGGSFLLMLISFVCVGIANVSVINCLVTYLVIEFPRSLGFSMVALFLFANLGMFIEMVFHDILTGRSFYPFFCLTALVLLGIAICFGYIKFFNPVVPKHLAHLRKGSLIWKELHYRLGLFILAMIFYGIVETIFVTWGTIYLLKFMDEMQMQHTLTCFWAFMIFGQLLLLAPIYFFSARKVFSLMILFVIGVTFFLEQQTSLTGLMGSYMAAGLGCSIFFPLLLAFIEKEVMETCELSEIKTPIAFIETGISLMIGGYLAGVGIISLWVLHHPPLPELYTLEPLRWLIILLALVGLIVTYLNWSAAKPDA